MGKFESYQSLENFFSNSYEDLGVKQYDFCCVYSDLRAFASEMKSKFEKNKFCHSIINPKTIIVNSKKYDSLSIIFLYDYDKTREILVESFNNDMSVFITKPFVQY